METEVKNWIGAEYLDYKFATDASGFSRYRVDKLGEDHHELLVANLSEEAYQYRLWWNAAHYITRIYKRAPIPDERGLVPEFFYQHVDILLRDTQYLPEDHFQHPNYDATKTKLRRAPGAGSYSEIHEGAFYTYLDALYPELGEQEGRALKINHTYEFCWIRKPNGHELPMSLGRFIPLTRNGAPLRGVVTPEPVIETPTIDYKALAKNWRRFNV